MAFGARVLENPDEDFKNKNCRRSRKAAMSNEELNNYKGKDAQYHRNREANEIQAEKEARIMRQKAN